MKRKRDDLIHSIQNKWNVITEWMASNKENMGTPNDVLS